MGADRSAVAQTRRLYRSRTDRKLAGVCGGLA
jgi:phage shock protein PspC (stress-responsive transcriptional regulator)